MNRYSGSDVSAVFREMADLLSLKGGERHRARAFGRVARVIENLPEPIDRMLRYGTLQKMPGVGDGTVHRVKQILRTGTCDDLLRLRAALPAGLREMVRLRGIGASTARRLYRQHRISSIEQLESAIRSGYLRERARFSVDKLHAILHEIEVHKRYLGKVPLFEALATSDAFAAELRTVSGVADVSAGGSCRRRKAMIGDLDLLAASDDPAPVVDRFVHLPGVAAVLTRGDDTASVRLASGQQVDIWVFPVACWGAGLHAFSGSKQHVVAIRRRAGLMGLHVSQHGVTHRDRSRRLTTGRTEEEIFAAVGLPFIPPELRENVGEIEAAERGRLPRLVTEEDLRGDLHLHTRDSDGSGSAHDMAVAAADLGYEYLAITDHSRSLGVAHGLDERRLAAQVEQLRRLEQGLGRIRVLAGTEVDILPDGCLDLDPSILRRLDWVVASVHEHMDMDAGAMTDRVLRAMETGLVDCVAHPTGRKLGRREPYPIDLERVMAAAARLGVALEVNGGVRRMDLDDVSCRRAREAGVEVVINTDAHSPAHLARRTFGLASARRGWLEPRNVLNTRPAAAVTAFRQARLRREGLVVAVPEVSPPIREVPSLAGDDAADRTTGEIPAQPPATAADSRESLVAALGRRPLEDGVRERLRRYLELGDDSELESALTRLSGNPLQGAFDLLMSG